MAEQGGSSQGSPAKVAQRIDPKTERLTPEQRASMQRAETAAWGRKAAKMRNRNRLTGLLIGGIVLGIYGYTFYSVPQEKFLDELEGDAKVARANHLKTSAN
uniref:Cytochrome c oxidase assembly factor 3 n=1 Tax=Leptobrachium leishanense TaxID=445787 RepID=A0A8C5MMV2_9ANUR